MNSQGLIPTVFCQIIIKEIEKDELSLFIETKLDNDLKAYSKIINIKKELLDKNNNQINLANCFNNKKVSIIERNDKELILLLIEYNKKIKLKKIEFYILWRDSNYTLNIKNMNNVYYSDLKIFELFCKENNIFVYFVNSTEEALKFLKKRICYNIIFITNVGKNLPGKRYIEKIRKIYGFNVIVLFFSNNNEHFSWIKNFPNCLYDDYEDIVKEYITKFNKEDLKKLRKKNMKKIKKLELKEFSNDFFDYYKVEKGIKIPNIEFKIFCTNINKYLYMNEKGEVQLIEQYNNNCKWDIIFLDNTVTLYSNGYYLKEGNKGDIKGFNFTYVWNFKLVKNKYIFLINPTNNKILSLEENNLKVCDLSPNKNILLKLIDLEAEQENNNIIQESLSDSESNLTQNIFNLTDSISLFSNSLLLLKKNK